MCKCFMSRRSIDCLPPMLVLFMSSKRWSGHGFLRLNGTVRGQLVKRHFLVSREIAEKGCNAMVNEELQRPMNG